jgi:hypothetical protein
MQEMNLHAVQYWFRAFALSEARLCRIVGDSTVAVCGFVGVKQINRRMMSMAQTEHS